MRIVPESIESYAIRHSHPMGDIFDRLREETYAKTEIPQMQVGPLEGAFLRMLVRLTRARRVLEIGTFTGYSALAMAEALPEDGELVTCDIDPSATAIARRFWDQSPHGKKIRLELGPAIETLKRLKGPFEMAFLDADKESYSAYWDVVAPLVPSGGLIVVDNTLWSGRVIQPEDRSDQAIAALNQKAKSDPRFETVLLTVRDGMLLGWKK